MSFVERIRNKHAKLFSETFGINRDLPSQRTFGTIQKGKQYIFFFFFCLSNHTQQYICQQKKKKKNQNRRPSIIMEETPNMKLTQKTVVTS
jgi:hypothetical protein